MICAVGGVKGGIGKSTYSVMLAKELAEQGKDVMLIDGDVGGAYDHRLLGATLKDHVADVIVNYPVFNHEKCAKCGMCAKKCPENAILMGPDGPLFVESLCSACGLCFVVCKNDAISPEPRKIGEIKEYAKGRIRVISPVTFVSGEVQTHIARKLRAIAKQEEHNVDEVIIDLPAGMHCDVLCLLDLAEKFIVVTEPTPLGCHDLRLSIDLGKKMGKEIEVVLNKYGLGCEREIEQICDENDVRIVRTIKYDVGIFNKYARV